MNLAAHLSKTALTFADRPALTVGTRLVHTYAQLAERAARLAGALRGRFSLVPGDRVAIIMSNRPAFFEVLYGAWHAGLAVAPINARLHQREFEYILRNVNAKLCFVSADLAETVAPLVATLPDLAEAVVVDQPDYERLFQTEPVTMVDVAPTAVAWLFYTSGTTGRPKGAMLTHRNLLMMILSYYADIDQLSSSDTVIHAAPMSHASGLYGLPHIARGGNHVVPESGHFEPGELCALIGQHDSISMFAAPTMLMRLANSAPAGDADFSHIKSIVYGGGPMYVADLMNALDVIGPRLVQIYGLGESPCTITCLPKAMHADREHPRYLDRLGSAGFARTDVEVKLVDDAGHILPPGEIGEVAVRGDVVMAGYWDNPEATERSLRGGWLHTGDIGVFDDQGFLTLKDRSNDMIISGGTNIYPREIEEVLLRHEAVVEVSVVGRPHPEWGEEVVAFVVSGGGRDVSEADLDKLCLDNIARFKRPKVYRFVEALPKNNYGKVLKTELRNALADEK
ncbi:MAG: AMP-binding protein [Proteobacteria bacterium]|nr:AMP-binding protein [Pseudomonadota bacterium]